ncbi:MAG: AsmA family protein, partial [Candidatus Sulfomarinibacteraceae bacterium]
MTRRRKLVLGLVLVVTLSIGSVLLYLAVSDLSGWRDSAARLASSAMHRELTIAGDFTVDIGVITRVHATDLTLANTAWGSEPIMARIDRLDAEIDLRALLAGSIHLPRIEINGGRTVFESNADSGSNWALGKPGGAAGGGGPVRLRIDAIRARSVDLVFRTAAAERDWDIAIAELDSTGDDSGSQRLAVSGSLRGLPFDISGELGSLEGLVNLESVRHDLELKLGQSRASSAGAIAELGSLSGLDLESQVTIPDPVEVTSLLGLPDAPLRSVAGRLSARPHDGATAVSVRIDGPAATLELDGTLDSVIRPSVLDADLRYRGPDVRPVAVLLGVTDLPKRPFDVAGRFRWRGFPIEVSGLEITVGDNRISADGRVGKPPLMLDTDFEIHGAGPNIAVVTAMVGLELPHDPFTVDGRLVRVEDGLQVENVRGTVGTTWFAAGGFIGDPPAYLNTRLDLELREPDLSRLGPALGVALPEDPLTAKARLAQGAGAIDLEEATAEIGDARLRVDGRLTTVEKMVGSDLRFDVDGLDLLDIAALFEIEGLPASPVRAGGRLRFVEDGLELDSVTIEVPGATLGAHGLVVPVGGLEGTTLSIDASGADASIFDPLLPAGTLPPESFRVAGGIRVEPDAVAFDSLEISLAGTTGRVDGRMSTLRGLAGTDVELRLDSPSLAALDPLLPGVALPDSPFSAAAGVAASDNRVDLRSLKIDLDVVSLSIDGVLALTDGLIGSQLRVAGEGGDLGALADGIDAVFATELPVMPT